MHAPREVEIKFLVDDINSLEQQLRAAGFQQRTPPTHELNTLYDLPGDKLRQKGEILRIRKYGNKWKLTHKSKGAAGRHKVRVERETSLGDGEQMDGLLQALGYKPVFIYEKFRAEWTDGQGEVVVDRTPIGNIAEIEGTPEWIDATAAMLGIPHERYITASYGALFEDWRKQSRSKARNMTFSEVGLAPPPF